MSNTLSTASMGRGGPIDGQRSAADPTPSWPPPSCARLRARRCRCKGEEPTPITGWLITQERMHHLSEGSTLFCVLCCVLRGRKTDSQLILTLNESYTTMTKGISRNQKIKAVKARIARQLRKEQAQAERKLWSVLRKKRMNARKFRRQQVIDGFIVDFYCPRLGLVIEVDGGYHHRQWRYDQERQSILEQRGLRVLRFTNGDVLQRFRDVVWTLEEATK
mgnify:CR=1 FL=1